MPTTTSLTNQDDKRTSTIRTILNLSHDQMMRELKSELDQILYDSDQFKEMDPENHEQLAKAFRLPRHQISWHRNHLCKAIERSRGVHIGDLSGRTGNTIIRIKHNKNRLRDDLATTVSHNLIYRCRDVGQLEVFADTVNLTSDSVVALHLKWDLLNEDDLQCELVGSKATSHDWLAKLIAKNAQKLAAAVQRGFSLNTMVQSRKMRGES